MTYAQWRSLVDGIEYDIIPKSGVRQIGFNDTDGTDSSGITEIGFSSGGEEIANIKEIGVNT